MSKANKADFRIFDLKILENLFLILCTHIMDQFFIKTIIKKPSNMLPMIIYSNIETNDSNNSATCIF